MTAKELLMRPPTYSGQKYFWREDKGILVIFIFSLTKTKKTTNDSSLPELSTPWLSIIIPERRV